MNTEDLRLKNKSLLRNRILESPGSCKIGKAKIQARIFRQPYPGCCWAFDEKGRTDRLLFFAHETAKKNRMRLTKPQKKV
jgi:hypothetical protein